jgi:hypothetical protein
MELIVFAIQTTLLGVMASLPALLIGNALERKGLVLQMPVVVLAVVVAVMFVLRLLLPDSPWYRLVLTVAVASPLIYSRSLWMPLKLGRWWWLDRNKDDRS